MPWRRWPLVVVLVGLLVGVAPAHALTDRGAQWSLGSLTANVTTTATGTAITVKGFSTATVHVRGSGTFTVAFLVSVDGSDPEAIGCVPVAAPAGAAVTTVTTNGIWRCNVAAVAGWLRIDVTACSSCAVRASIGSSDAVSE